MSRRDAVNAALSKLDKRTKIMIGALLVIIVGGIGFFALKSSPATDTAITVPTHHVTPTPSASAKAKATVAPNNLPVQADPARDPFTPLAQESLAAGTSGTAATVATTTTSTTSTGATTTSPITTPTPTPTPTPAPTTSHSITLISINGVNADVTYNGTDKTVKAGTSLASGVVCIKVTDDSIFVTYASKAYAIAPGQTIAF